MSLQNKMDLPPDKMRVLRNYELSKKWDLVMDQVCWISAFLLVILANFVFSGDSSGCCINWIVTD